MWLLSNLLFLIIAVDVVPLGSNAQLQYYQTPGSSTCRCIDPLTLGYIQKSSAGFLDLNTTNYDIRLDEAYGSFCDTWENRTHNGDWMFPSSCNAPPTAANAWCRDQWCYVDPCSCELTDATQSDIWVEMFPVSAARLAYSYQTCAQCHRRTTSIKCNEQSSCEWAGGICRDKTNPKS